MKIGTEKQIQPFFDIPQSKGLNRYQKILLGSSFGCKKSIIFHLPHYEFPQLSSRQCTFLKLIIFFLLYENDKPRYLIFSHCVTTHADLIRILTFKKNFQYLCHYNICAIFPEFRASEFQSFRLFLDRYLGQFETILPCTV